MRLTDAQIKQLPFRGGKFNVAPDDERCKACGRCCVKYGVIPLLPIDFKLRNLEKEFRCLAEMHILGNSPFTDYPRIVIHQGEGCSILSDKGCRLRADVRPVACGHHMPRFDKRNRHICGFKLSNWYTDLTYKQRCWTTRQTNLLYKVLDETGQRLQYSLG